MADQPTESAPLDDATGLLSLYWKEINRYDKATEKWREEADAVVKLYLDEMRTEASPRRFPLLWSNIETLKPAVYAKVPTVQCGRRFNDKDRTGRIAAEMMERISNTAFELYKVDETFRLIRDDRLLPGRGQAWVRYEASFETVKDKAQEDDEDGSYDRLASEKVCLDYIHWQDFGHSVARTWADVPLVWRRVYMNRKRAKARFGKEKASKLSYTAKAPEDQDGTATKAIIYELWDKARGKVIWISKECPEVLDESDPPTNFHDFFPCPEPCYATKTSKALIPVPDYRYYRDQAKEINDLTDKIAKLTDWLKLKGFIAGGASSEGADAVAQLVKEVSSQANDAVLVKVESWAAFSEKGGAGKMIEWLPLDQVIVALKGAMEARAQVIQDVYQITGISDILRGETDPTETLGAQQLKAQTGTRRIRNTRDEVSRFTRDIARLMCEVIAEQFQPETLAAMSGFKYLPTPDPNTISLQQTAPGVYGTPGVPSTPAPGGPLGGLAGGPPNSQPGAPPPPVGGLPALPPGSPPPPEQSLTFDDEVVALLRNDGLRSFRIEVETDSTIQPDEDADKLRTNEFLQTVGSFFQQALPVVQAMPQAAPMLGEILKFAVRKHRAGRQLEDVIEQGVAQMTQMAQQPPPADPKVIEAQAKAEIDKQRAMLEGQLAQAKAQSDAEIAKAKAAAEAEIARSKADNEMEIARVKAANEMEIAKAKSVHECEMQSKAVDHENMLKTSRAAVEDDQKSKAHAQELEHKETASRQELEHKKQATEAEGEKEAGKPVAHAIETALEKFADRLDKFAATPIKMQMPKRIKDAEFDSEGNIKRTVERDA